jgi:cadmium resistance protein CadD (predicted permease)
LDIPTIIGLGIAAFLGSNIDDLFILTVFFANRKFPTYQTVLGQYVGMGALLAVSALASFLALVVPTNLLGLIGLFPIAIGIKELMELLKKDDEDGNKRLETRKISYLPFLTVAAVTFSGGEEIGIYGSIFATNNQVGEIITIVLLSLVLTGIWCLIAHYLTYRSFVAERFHRIGARVLPFILVGLGLYILGEAYLMPG